MKYLMRARPSPAMVVALIALFIALGGTAVALSGKNTVQSDDIGPGAQVKAADIANDAVAAPRWRRIGTAGQPGFNHTPSCGWHNYDQVHSTAAFTRDAAGFVHLKGTVIAEDLSFNGSCLNGAATNPMMFILPPGYRPKKRAAMSVPDVGVTANENAATLVIDGPSISALPAGAVSIDHDDLHASESLFVLDGTSFRCEPSGQQRLSIVA